MKTSRHLFVLLFRVRTSPWDVELINVSWIWIGSQKTVSFLSFLITIETNIFNSKPSFFILRNTNIHLKKSENHKILNLTEKSRIRGTDCCSVISIWQGQSIERAMNSCKLQDQYSIWYKKIFNDDESKTNFRYVFLTSVAVFYIQSSKHKEKSRALNFFVRKVFDWKLDIYLFFL